MTILIRQIMSPPEVFKKIKYIANRETELRGYSVKVLDIVATALEKYINDYYDDNRVI